MRRTGNRHSPTSASGHRAENFISTPAKTSTPASLAFVRPRSQAGVEVFRLPLPTYLTLGWMQGTLAIRKPGRNGQATKLPPTPQARRRGVCPHLNSAQPRTHVHVTFAQSINDRISLFLRLGRGKGIIKGSSRLRGRPEKTCQGRERAGEAGTGPRALGRGSGRNGACASLCTPCHQLTRLHPPNGERKSDLATCSWKVGAGSPHTGMISIGARSRTEMIAFKGPGNNDIRARKVIPLSVCSRLSHRCGKDVIRKRMRKRRTRRSRLQSKNS